MPHFIIVLIPYINLLNLSWIIKCLFLRNKEALSKPTVPWLWPFLVSLYACYLSACHVQLLCMWCMGDVKRLPVHTHLSLDVKETYLLTSLPYEDSNQSGHAPSLIRAFIVLMKTFCILGLYRMRQWRFWSDCANAQADLKFRWAHMSASTFSDVAALSLLLLFQSSGMALQWLCILAVFGACGVTDLPILII